MQGAPHGVQRILFLGETTGSLRHAQALGFRIEQRLDGLREGGWFTCRDFHRHMGRSIHRQRHLVGRNTWQTGGHGLQQGDAKILRV